MAVPDGDDVLVLTHTNRAPADFGPLALRCGPVLLAPARLRAVGRRVSSRALGELVANDSEDEVLPKAVRNALAETDYPLAAGEVKRVLPDGTADARVEEEIVSGGKEGGRRVEVCPEGPEGLDLRTVGQMSGLGKGGDRGGRTELNAETFLMPSS